MSRSGLVRPAQLASPSVGSALNEIQGVSVQKRDPEYRLVAMSAVFEKPDFHDRARRTATRPGVRGAIAIGIVPARLR